MSNGRGIIQGRTRINQPAPVSALWSCPSCGAENPGTVDDGCQNPDCATRQVYERPARPMLRHCAKHLQYIDSCHDCYDLEYGHEPKAALPPPSPQGQQEETPEEVRLAAAFQGWCLAKFGDGRIGEDFRALLWDAFSCGVRASHPKHWAGTLLNALVLAHGAAPEIPDVQTLMRAISDRIDADPAFEENLASLLELE